MEGRVVVYDPARGLGTVEAADGRRYGFHCTRLTGTRRDVKAGTPVRFRVVPGNLGLWEADAVDPT